MLTKEHAEILRSIVDNVPGGTSRGEVRDVIAAIEFDLADCAKRDSEYQALQDIGQSAAESIAEMVAALECDYERLEELREERETLTDADKEARASLLAFGYASGEESRERLAVLKSEASDAAAALSEWVAEYAEELAGLEKAAGECESREDAEQRIHEDPLSVEVRNTEWHAPGEAGADVSSPDEFCILLSTGGPATRIIGELDEHGEPTRARLQAQDWFKPWTDYTSDAISQDDLLTYCRCFYFGE